MIVNLTPHELNIHVYPAVGGTTVVSVHSSGVARCAETVRPTGDTIGHYPSPVGVPIVETTYGDVEGLPAPVAGTRYVVSRIVRSALGAGTRPDVLCPGKGVRDEAGRIIGCEGLSR